MPASILPVAGTGSRCPARAPSKDVRSGVYSNGRPGSGWTGYGRFDPGRRYRGAREVRGEGTAQVENNNPTGQGCARGRRQAPRTAAGAAGCWMAAPQGPNSRPAARPHATDMTPAVPRGRRARGSSRRPPLVSRVGAVQPGARVARAPGLAGAGRLLTALLSPPGCQGPVCGAMPRRCQPPVAGSEAGRCSGVGDPRPAGGSAAGRPGSNTAVAGAKRGGRTLVWHADGLAALPVGVAGGTRVVRGAPRAEACPREAASSRRGKPATKCGHGSAAAFERSGGPDP